MLNNFSSFLHIPDLEYYTRPNLKKDLIALIITYMEKGKFLQGLWNPVSIHK